MKPPSVLLVICSVILLSSSIRAEDDPGKKTFEIRIAERSQQTQLEKYILKGKTQDEELFVYPEKNFDSRDIVKAEFKVLPHGQRVLSVTFTEDGAKRYQEFTRSFKGKTIAIFLNGIVAHASTIIERDKADMEYYFIND